MMEILPILVNDQFERIAAIDDYKSFIWTTRYYTTGDFELVVPVKPEYLDMFRQDYFIVRNDDPNNTGIIEEITLNRDADDKNIMIITGRMLDSILGRRIIAQQTTVSDDVIKNIRLLITRNAYTTPANIKRQIPRLGIDTTAFPNDELGESFEAQYTGQNLLDTVEKICMEYGIGKHGSFGGTTSAGTYYHIVFYQGTDRSYDQSVNPHVVFSDEYGNLSEAYYAENYTNMVNAVLVAGEGEGLSRKTIWSENGEPSDIQRHEEYMDRRDIRSDDGITEEEYFRMLAAAGRSAWTSYAVAFQGIAQFGEVRYNEDVFLGDLVQVESTSWGLSMKARLVEVIESVDETGAYTIMPTFGV